MAYYNKFKDVEVALPDIRCGGIGGEFKLEAFKGVEFPRGSGQVYEFAGTRRVLQDWSPNLVTNFGLDSIGDSTNRFQAGAFHVGTGSTPPQNTDQTLASYVASAGNTGYTPSAQSTAPYYGVTEIVGLFSPGFAGGNVNLNEIGMSPTNLDQTSLSSRSLTVNESGNPASVSVLADEYLECYYRRRNYPAHIVEATGAPTDDTGTVNIQGVNYGYTIRPFRVTYGGSYSVGTGVGWGTFMYNQNPTVGYSDDIYNSAMGYQSNMTLGTVTGSPGGTKQTGASGPNSTIRGSYSSGTYNLLIGYQWGIDRLNDAGGIGGLVLKTRLGAYQLKFDSPVPKEYGQVFTFYHNFSWNRKTSWV